MLRLRHENNGNIELLMHIAECLDAIITQKQKDPYADQTEIALFESAMLDAKQTYTDLLEVLRVINRVDPVAVAMEHANNQLTAAADLHNAHNAA
jgi:transcriptional regulatory protein LevR